MNLRRLVPMLVLVALAASACANIAAAAAVVDGIKISESEVEEGLDVLRTDPTFQELLAQQPDQVRGNERRRILTGLIRQAVLIREAEVLEIEVTQEQIDELINDQAARQGLSADELLEGLNLTRETGNALAERIVREFAIRDVIAADVEVSDEQVAEAYATNQAAFEEVRLLRLTVASVDEAQEAIDDIEAGRGFFTVAREVSTDAAADDGGDLGYVPVAELAGATASAIDATSSRGLTEPVPSAAGFEVYQVLDRRPRPLEDVADQIRGRLLDAERQGVFDVWMTGKLREADVVVNPKYGTFDVEALEVVAAQ